MIPDGKINVVHVGPKETETPHIWIEIENIENPKVLYKLIAYATGEDIPLNCVKSVGTIFSHGRSRIWHLYLLKKEKSVKIKIE